MQQISTLRNRLNPKGQWVQLGVLSATVVTPLLSRWNELRAAERARALREEAEDRLRGARALLPQSRREARQRMNTIVQQATEKVSSPSRSHRLSSTLWLSGAAVGLAVAGVTAYIVVRRQLDLNVSEPLVILPMPSRNGHDTQQGSQANHNASPQASTAPAADQAVATLAGAADEATNDESATALEDVPIGIEDAAEAKFIGNVRTLVFHEADAEDLPAENNRVYFASEEEARLAGYRRDRDEVASESEAEVGE